MCNHKAVRNKIQSTERVGAENKHCNTKDQMKIKWLFRHFSKSLLDIPTRKLHPHESTPMQDRTFASAAPEWPEWPSLGSRWVSPCAQQRPKPNPASWQHPGKKMAQTSWNTVTWKIEIRVALFKWLYHPAFLTCYMQIQLDETQGGSPPRRSGST